MDSVDVVAAGSVVVDRTCSVVLDVDGGADVDVAALVVERAAVVGAAVTGAAVVGAAVVDADDADVSGTESSPTVVDSVDGAVVDAAVVSVVAGAAVVGADVEVDVDVVDSCASTRADPGATAKAKASATMTSHGARALFGPSLLWFTSPRP